jgi:hypothetical protein
VVLALPNFSEIQHLAIADGNPQLAQQTTVGGKSFPVTDQVEGTFDVRYSKHEVYANATRSLLSDVIRAMADPDHKLRVPLECGIEALHLSIEATKRSLVS